MLVLLLLLIRPPPRLGRREMRFSSRYLQTASQMSDGGQELLQRT